MPYECVLALDPDADPPGEAVPTAGPPPPANRHQATGGSCLIAIGSGVVGDIALPQERGKYMGIFNLTSTFGPASKSVTGDKRAFG